MMSTASNTSLKQSCSALTSATSALEVIFNVIRSINPRFTYLLTYLQAPGTWIDIPEYPYTLSTRHSTTLLQVVDESSVSYDVAGTGHDIACIYSDRGEADGDNRPRLHDGNRRFNCHHYLYGYWSTDSGD